MPDTAEDLLSFKGDSLSLITIEGVKDWIAKSHPRHHIQRWDRDIQNPKRRLITLSPTFGHSSE